METNFETLFTSLIFLCIWNEMKWNLHVGCHGSGDGKPRYKSNKCVNNYKWKLRVVQHIWFSSKKSFQRVCNSWKQLCVLLSLGCLLHLPWNPGKWYGCFMEFQTDTTFTHLCALKHHFGIKIKELHSPIAWLEGSCLNARPWDKANSPKWWLSFVMQILSATAYRRLKSNLFFHFWYFWG